MVTKTEAKKTAKKILAENEKIINAALAIMDEVEYDSDVHTWAEQIRELADKIEDWSEDPALR